MSVVKQIVCLANSRKPSGRCVAGKEVSVDGTGRWVRPVSDRPTEDVSDGERAYRDGSDPQVLDIVDVPLLASRPRSHQTENWLLDPHSRWVKRGRVSWDDLQTYTDAPIRLWVNGYCSFEGMNDRVRQVDAGLQRRSLYLLSLRELSIRVFAPGATFGTLKRRVQAEFSYGGTTYRLWVTDPQIERRYLTGPDGEFLLGRCYVTVSLGEAYSDGYCYKLVAAIVTRARAQA